MAHSRKFDFCFCLIQILNDKISDAIMEERVKILVVEVSIACVILGSLDSTVRMTKTRALLVLACK